MKEDVAELEMKTIIKNQIEKSNFMKEKISENSNLLGTSKKRVREDYSETQADLIKSGSDKKDKNGSAKKD